MTPLDWSQCDAVESVPDEVSGAWVFKGSRVPVATVFANLLAGLSVEEIVEELPVTQDQIKAALRFVRESVASRPPQA